VELGPLGFDVLHRSCAHRMQQDESESVSAS
jgi:hypothetical protein